MSGYILIADGACSKNPGPGGYGTIVITPHLQVAEFGGGEENTTNNRMELMGFYRGLEEVLRIFSREQLGPKTLRAVLDSSYVIHGAEKYIWNWSKNGWKTQAGEVKNQDLWELILGALGRAKAVGFDIQYEQVKGHSGHEGNERADQISVAFARKQNIDLYFGPLSNYSVRLDARPYQPLYLSYVEGKLQKHQTWMECELRVKGKAGARFKKVTNRLQEEEVLKGWGLI